MSPKESFTLPTLMNCTVKTDNDFRSAVDSVLESLILGEVILILESGNSRGELADTVSAVLLGRLYSLSADESVNWVRRFRKASGLGEIEDTGADHSQVRRLLAFTDFD